MQLLIDRSRKLTKIAPAPPAPAALALGLLLFSHLPALALSELQEAPPPPSEDTIEQVPLPAPIQIPSSGPAQSGPEAEGGAAPGGPPQRDIMRPNLGGEQAAPEISHDFDKLPEPVQRMRKLIIEACMSGDVEALRPLVGMGENGTRLSLGGFDGDPVAFLRELSGDDEGQEILAILLEVLQAGYAHLDAGTSSEIYVWPYFFALPLDSLDKRQRVELFTIVTAGDYEDMKSFGAYIFYRVGITPEGRWAFFVAGD